MKISKVFLLSLVLLSGQAMAEFVVGPSTGGAVFGPAASEGSSLDIGNIKAQVKNTEGSNSNLQLEMYLLDNADGKLSCKYDENVAKTLSLETGVNRLYTIMDTITVLDNPNIAQPVGNADMSQSSAMYTASQSLNTAALTANENAANEKNKLFKERCHNISKQMSGSGELQLYTYSCVLYQVLGNLSDLYADSDALYQASIELNTSLNQAMTENTARENAVQKEKEKVKQVNEELKKAIDKLKKAKEAQKKADEALKTAQAALTAAQSAASECKENCDGVNEALASAAKAAGEAQVAKTKADDALKTAANELIALLKDKMKMETNAILALLSGTIHGDVNGKDVHFTASGKDYTLIDSEKAIDEMIGLKGYHGHWGRYQEENPNGSEADFMSKIEEGATEDFLRIMAGRLEKNGTSAPDNSKCDSIWCSDAMNFSASGAAATYFHGDKVLEEFTKMGSSGYDNLETIALAIGEYSGSKADAQNSAIGGMKTPTERMATISKKIEEINRLNQRTRIMIQNNLCYFDSLIEIYKTTFDKMGYKVVNNPTPIDPFLIYIYKLESAPYKKKFQEGYGSKVNVDVLYNEYYQKMMSSTGFTKKGN